MIATHNELLSRSREPPLASVNARHLAAFHSLGSPGQKAQSCEFAKYVSQEENEASEPSC